jgi:hypothetical protein
MKNPWRHLPRRPPLVLPMDRAAIEEFNSRLPDRSPYRVDVLQVVPEPFIGHALKARVIVLQLNPGLDSRRDPSAHRQLAFRRSLFGNLRQTRTRYPFYYFDSRFRMSTPGGRWWTTKTRRLTDKVPSERLASTLAVIEWFPYKSTKFKAGCTVPSQEYSFWLLRAAMKRRALIVVSRGLRAWQASVPELRNYTRKLTLSSVQNIALSPNNLKLRGRKTPKAWDLLIRALLREPRTARTRQAGTSLA